MKIKKVAALFLTAVMLMLPVSCTTDSKNIQDDDKSKAESTVLSPDDELTLVIGSHPSWPYDENWVVWKYFKEAIGGKININAIPNSEIGTKVSIMMASPDSLPDLLHTDYKLTADNYAAQGALVAIDDYTDIMPNYTSFWSSVPEEERQELLTMRKSADGKTYYPQIYGMDRQKNVRAWLYRKDIFEKHDIKTPETLDELYVVAKKLKELYPDSYPICMRTGLRNIKVIGSQWKPGFNYDVYYDFENKKWSFGATEDVMIDIINYLKKLREEGLVPPDYLTINTKTWEELISTGRGLIMPEYQTRISFFHSAARTENPEFTLDAMMPPRADSPAGQNKVAKYNVDPTGFVICNTNNKKRIENSIKVIDWFYSDEGSELMSWGREGETYEIKDGKKQFILDNETDNVNLKYGFQTLGTYLRIDPEAADAVAPEEQRKTTDFILEYTEKKSNPATWVAMNDEEMRVKNDIGNAIITFTDEMLSKFLLGQEPLSKWDSFRAELEDMGLRQFLSAYESAYNRVAG